MNNKASFLESSILYLYKNSKYFSPVPIMEAYAFKYPFPYAYILIVIIIPPQQKNIHLPTCFVLVQEMKQIADEPTTAFTFIVLLIQKQSNNFINSNICINL